MATDFADLLLHILGKGESVEGSSARSYEILTQVGGSGQRRGTISLDIDSLDIGKPDDYGQILGDCLAKTSAVTSGLIEAHGQAEEGVRLRLQIDDEAEALHGLRWELLKLPLAGSVTEAATSSAFAFSRYLPLPEQDRTPPSDPVFKVLLAIANPLGLPAELEIPVERELASLLEEFENLPDLARLRVQVLPGRTGISAELTKRIEAAGWTVSQGNASLRRIQTELQRGCQALHLICHGKKSRGGGGELTLEDDGAGGKVQVPGADLSAWYHPRLQLIVFQSCRTGEVPWNQLPFATIAGRMVIEGVPAIIAMQDFVAMDDARYFSAAFYRSLLRDGLVDAAANRGRLAMRERAGEMNWSIPALYQRLKGGMLWSPDVVREYLLQARRELGDASGSMDLPLKVVEHSRGLKYDAAQGASGVWDSMNKRTTDLLSGEPVEAVLTGPAGCNKTKQVEKLFRDFSQRFLTSASPVPPRAPLLLGLGDLSPWMARDKAGPGQDLFADLRRVADGRGVPERLAKRRFLFLVVRGDGLTKSARIEALWALKQLLERFPGSSCLIVYNESDLQDLAAFFEDAKVLVVQPMNPLELQAYLRRESPELLKTLTMNRLIDLATSPWLLGQMRDQVRIRGSKRALMSRADVLEFCVSRLLSRFDCPHIPLRMAEAVLERIAWEIQVRRPNMPDRASALVLDQGAVEKLFVEIRGTGEFSIADMRRELVACGALSPSGEGGVRFTYESVQAFFASRYLAKSPQSAALVDNLAATFGRLGRLRDWTETLVILAALPEFKDKREGLLNSILTGSSMVEGEQIYLAAQLYVEMNTSLAGVEAKSAKEMSPFDRLVRQMVDTLVWLVRDFGGRPYHDRLVAVKRLAAMRHPDAVPHLISMACDPLPAARSARSNRDKYEYAGIRLVALAGLFEQIDETIKAVQKRPGADAYLKVINGWMAMYQDPEKSEGVLGCLDADEARFSPVAAFALFQFGQDAVEKYLLNGRYLNRGEVPPKDKPLRNYDLLWCITEALSWMDGDWLAAKVIDPSLEPDEWQTEEPREDLRTMLCFLVRQLGNAPPGSPRWNYLVRSLRDSKDTKTRVWALRALAKLQGADDSNPADDTNARRICHAILSGDTKGLNLAIKPDWRWTMGALEALRDCGDETSVELIRESRLQHFDDPMLFRFHFQVAEELYWRSTGGMIKATTQ